MNARPRPDAMASERAADGDDQTDESLSRAAQDDRDRTTARRPEASDPSEQGLFAVPNYAQDLVDVEFVIDGEDSAVPESVDASGLVVVDEETYVGLLAVRPRSWSIHTAQRKAEIVETFQSAVLAPLEFPIQIVAYPTRLDISDHVAEVSAASEHGRGDPPTLVETGRELYPAWLEAFIEDNDMKQRRFYLVVPVSADTISQFDERDSGLAATIEERFPPLAPLVGWLSDTETTDVTRRQCIRELNARMNRLQTGLQRLDVRAERLRDRQAVLSVLYHYYNNERPGIDLDPGPVTTAARPEGEQ